MSKTPVESSGEVKVKVASHLSNLPTIATDDSTSNFMVLSACVSSKTGTCARPMDGNAESTNRQMIVNRIAESLSPYQPIVNRSKRMEAGENFKVNSMGDGQGRDTPMARDTSAPK